ncbi:hypothetical protein CWS43_03185 [Rahnella sp. AA]|uniref:AAA family ATPase n=1 Tax=Rahnella sp. AA TaxID=2057180 RepID=UPI000C33B42C|nr:AAA family ATPase [Rahnella sp. AA]PKE32914.1 hypothetical protein CWS43_03185 [Rahnella sp. AA]
MDRETALKKFKILQNEFSSYKDKIHEANEATARLLIIDRILNLLGWNSEEFNPETYCGAAGYSDYMLSINNNPKLIVEAKKNGITFGYPIRTAKSNEYYVSYFKNAFKKPLSDVIEQAQRYCVDKAVSHAVLTNGGEWIVCPMLPKPGRTIDNMKGIYFGNIFSEDFAFDLMWNLISKKAISENTLDIYLSDINHKPSEVCHILRNTYGALKWQNGNNDIWLDEFYQSFFSQITDTNQRNMLEHCFVSDSKLDQFKGELKRVLKDSTPSYLPNGTHDFNPSESKDFLLSQHYGKVIIITGAVGCGKSTLVTKCLVEARQAKNTYATPIIIDLINDVSKRTVDAKSIVFEYLYKEVKINYPEEFSLDELRNTFSHELKILKNGAYKELFEQDKSIFFIKEAELLDKESSNHQNMVLRIFKKRTNEGKAVILILDNVDRASESFQEEIYALSHLISNESGATVIITLREFTFFRNKDKGFLDVRPEDKIIHLKAPDFGKLISSRVRYIKDFIETDFRIKDWRRKYDIKEFISTMQTHADTLRNNLQTSRDAASVLEILSSVSWHNVRTFYQLVKRVHGQLGSNTSPWNKTETISALMSNIELGENTFIPNIFKPYDNVNQCYFLKLRILSFLHDAITQGEISKGITLERIVNFALLYGYRKDWITKTLESSIEERIIECIEIPSDSDLIYEYNICKEHSFRITPLGVSLILDICHTPIYIALISIDLPFHEKKPYDEIKKDFEIISACVCDTNTSTISTDGISLIIESNMAKTSAQYLSSEYEREKLSLTELRNKQDINLTEKRVSKIAAQIVNIFNKTECVIKINSPDQYALAFSDEPSSGLENESDLSHLVPSKLEEAMLIHSEYVPLIFVSLVIRAVQGFETSMGVEITSIINEKIVSEDNNKFTNNVSRALRSKSLLSQDWLLVRDGLHHKFKKFSLSENWQLSWEKMFSEQAPKLK